MARLRIRDAGGTLRTIVRVRVRDETNVLRTIQRISARASSANLFKTVFQPFAAAITPSPVDGFLAGTATASVTTSAVTATPTGGTSPYTYAWAQTGSSPYAWTINSPAIASTSFTAAAVEVGAYATNLFQVTITDANGATATANVSASVRNAYEQPAEPYPDPCPTLDTLILLANDSGSGAGAASPVGDLKVGMMVWTRHELTWEWGAWPISAIEHVADQPICSLSGYPEVSPRHRFALPSWLARLLPSWLRWFRVGWLVRPSRTATVARISVAGPRTYCVKRPAPGAKWRLSHNIKNTG